MELVEKAGNLFDVEVGTYIAYYVPVNLNYTKSLPTEYREKFDLTPLEKAARRRLLNVGDCYSVGRTLNMIVKERHNSKYEYNHIEWVLTTMRSICLRAGIKKVAMPRLGEEEKVNWSKVSKMILNVFGEDDIRIEVYTPQEEKAVCL